jgi:hypothetical protein
MKLRVSVASREPPLEIELGAPEPTLRDLRVAIQSKQQVALPPAEDRLRIIAAGRVLRGSSIPLSKFGNFENTVIHCAISELYEASSIAKSSSLDAHDAWSDTRVDNVGSYSLTSGLRFAQNTVVHLLNGILGLLQFSPYFSQRPWGEQQTSAMPDDGFGSRETDDNPNAPPDENIESVSTGWDQDHEDGTLSDWASGYALGFFLGLIMLVLSMDTTLEPPKRWVRGVQYGVVSNFAFGIVLIVNNHHI